MNYKHILLCTLLVPVTFTIYGQESNEQKIQELEKSLNKKTNEISKLGKKIYKKKKILDKMAKDIQLSVEELCINFDQKEREQFSKTYYESLNKFLLNFCIIMRNNSTGKINIAGFLVQELTKNKTDNTNYFNSDKFAALRRLIEFHFLLKLIEKYEQCLEELDKIDQELNMLLGQSPINKNIAS
jgi:hypothetical protein